MSTLLLPCCYLAPASHYSSLWHAGDALIGRLCVTDA